VDANQHPVPILESLVVQPVLGRGGGGDVDVFTFEVGLDGFLCEARQIGQMVSSRKAPRKVGKCDAVCAVRVFVEIGGIEHGVPPMPTGLPVTGAQRPDGKVFARMWNGYVARLGWMLVLRIITLSSSP